jgi:catechol 2,3-dioxygenase
MTSTTTASELATFGAVHLEVTNRERLLAFWRDVVGLEVVNEVGETVELGAGGNPLVVLHQVATDPSSPGHSGLYHLALHLPDEAEFARVLARLIELRYPIAPTDHILSKAIYLDDPDSIGLELTLETPERVSKFSMSDAGGEVIDSEGRVRTGRDPLDVGQVLSALPDHEIRRPMPPTTIVGHIHLHVDDLDMAMAFYRDDLGFIEANYAPRFGLGDLHAGGRFPHRMAINTWQGAGAPQRPAGVAGMRHFTIRYDSTARLEEVTRRLPGVERTADGYLVHDPAGNVVLLTA